MSTFDSTKLSLKDILNQIQEGKIQLPDFQRGWVWDDNHIRDLLESISKSFPIGAVMLMETGGEVKFQTRPVEGIDENIMNKISPEKLILDGQQRLTTLTQAIAITYPVSTTTSKGKEIKRHYYFDIRKCLENPYDLENAILAVDENRQLRKNFGRDIDLDLSTRELECKQLYFPCDQIMNSDDWERKLFEIVRDKKDEEYRNIMDTFQEFRETILNSFRNYQIPVIQLLKETPKEAVCLVFEKVNTGGVQLSVFELVTAGFAAEKYNLRDDWYGSSIRNIESRYERVSRNPLLKGIETTDFLQAVTLLHTHQRKIDDIKNGKTGKKIRPVSAKRKDILNLPLSAWKTWADKVEKGFELTGMFLKKESFYSEKELPYGSQLVPLAAVLTILEDRWLEPKIYDKLVRWFWCGVLGELYGGAVETRIANDFEDIIKWVDDDNFEPRTVYDANFNQKRFFTLRSRLSAAYKGLNILVIREGAFDWFWKASIKELDLNEIAIDIHHIFPKDWCEKKGIKRENYDCILNKTPLSYKANRKIKAAAPSKYIKKIQKDKQVQANDDKMNGILKTHYVDPELMRKDDFDAFLRDRKERLSSLIEKAMGKNINRDNYDI